MKTLYGRASILRRLLWSALVLPIGAFAQLQVLQVNGGVESPVGAAYDAGTVVSGDTADILLRVKNLGSGPATVQTIQVTGAGFTLKALLLPFVLAPSAELDVHTSFSPVGAGSYSATFALNTIVVTTIKATAVPSALISYGGTQLSPGVTADLGQTEIGTTTTKSFTLTNPNATPVTIAGVTVTGAAFQGPAGITFPLPLAAGATASFQVTFAPQTGGAATGTLTVDQRTFNLTGLGLIPALPKGTIVLSSSIATSSQQPAVSIPLASASKTTGTGTLTMQFFPAAGLPDDAAIQFLTGSKRNATVTINPGDTTAKFGTQSSISFQTGTTAGSIVFTLTLPNSSAQFTLPIAPAAIGVDTATGVRRLDAVDVNIAGFDNTHSISQLAFTFYDAKGSVIQPGQIRVLSPPEFKQYFTANAAGGAFTMLASFPVTGDSSQIAGVDVQLTNTAGTAGTQRIAFQ